MSCGGGKGMFPGCDVGGVSLGVGLAVDGEVGVEGGEAVSETREGVSVNMIRVDGKAGQGRTF